MVCMCMKAYTVTFNNIFMHAIQGNIDAVCCLPGGVLDIDTILSKCLVYNSNIFTEEERQRIQKVVVDLADEDDEESVTYQGVCPDDKITTLLGDLIHTELQDVAGMSMIRQRALWFNSERATKPGVLALRRQDLEKRRAIVLQKERATHNKAQKAAEKAAKIAGAEEADDAVPRIDILLKGRCAGECSLSVRPLHVHGVDDEWRACAECDKIFCKKLNCQKKLLTHQKYCITARILDVG